MTTGIARAKNSPGLVYYRLFPVFFFVIYGKDTKNRWTDFLQKSPEFVASIKLSSHFPRGNQECQTIIIWHSSFFACSIITANFAIMIAEKQRRHER